MNEKKKAMWEERFRNLLEETEDGRLFETVMEKDHPRIRYLYENADDGQKQRLDDFFQRYSENYKLYLEFQKKLNSSYLEDKLKQDKKCCELKEAYEVVQKKRETVREGRNNLYYPVFLISLIPLLIWLLGRFVLKTEEQAMLILQVLMFLVSLSACITLLCIGSRGKEDKAGIVINAACMGFPLSVVIYVILDYILYRHIQSFLPELKISFMLYGIKALFFTVLVAAILFLLFTKPLMAVLLFFVGGALFGVLEHFVDVRLPEELAMQQISAVWMRGFLIAIALTAVVALIFSVSNNSREPEKMQREKAVNDAYQAYFQYRSYLVKKEIAKYEHHISEKYLQPWRAKIY